MLETGINNAPNYNLPVGRWASRGARGFKRGAQGFGRGLWAVKPGPVLLIIAVEAFLQACLAIRLYFSFQGGTPTGFIEQLHDFSDRLVSPFQSWDGTIMFHKGVFEISTIVAMDAYLFAGIAAIVMLVMLRSFVGFGRFVLRKHRQSRARRMALATEAQPSAATTGVKAREVA